METLDFNVLSLNEISLWCMGGLPRPLSSCYGMFWLCDLPPLV